MIKLKEVSKDCIAKLIQSMEQQHNMDSIHALCFLKQATFWKGKTSFKSSVYAPDGDFTDNTFLLILNVDDGVFCTYYSSSHVGCSRLRDALVNTQLVSARNYCILTSIPERVHSIVGLEWREKIAGPYQHSQNCHDYLLPHKEANALSVQHSEDVFIRDLTLADAEVINSNWPHRNKRSLTLIKETIANSICIGLCSKKSGELLSWALKWYYGGIGVVHTLEHARKKGYAQAVISVLCKRMAQDETWPINLVIIDKNAGSISLFTKMGFQKISKCYWFYYNVFENM